MSLRRWALKPSEARPLSREGLLLLAGRCALRVAPWCPPEAAKLWAQALSLLETAVRGEVLDGAQARSLARRLGDAGARACNALDGTADELTGRCMNYATGALALTLEAATLPDRNEVLRLVLDVAKQSTAFAALHAHAGLVRAPAGRDAVEYACVRVWDEIRRDVAVLAADEAGARTSPPATTRAPWTGRAPAWASPRGTSR